MWTKARCIAAIENRLPAAVVVEVAFKKPVILPGTVVAVALVLTFSAEVRLVVLEQITFVLALGSTTALLMLAYVIKEAALGFRAVDEALDRQPAAQQEAARLAGAAPRDDRGPLLRPAAVHGRRGGMVRSF